MRPILWTALVGVLAWTAATPVAAEGNGLIGLFTDLTATQSSATFDIGVPRTLYIVARLAGSTEPGITGAEFRVDGMPSGWWVSVTPAPAANITLGDPFRTTANGHCANIAFPSCQGGIGGCVLLYTVGVIATSEVPPTDLVVLMGDPPSNPDYLTPLLIGCDAPMYSKHEAEGGRFRIGVRTAYDLDYSLRSGYDLERGVLPERGLPGDRFCFRAVYTSADGSLPAAGWPRLELDVNGDGDADDMGEGSFTMSPADLDSTLTNGKEYRYDVALGEPSGGRYRYRMMALDSNGDPVPGRATAWRDSLHVGGPLVDIEVRAEEIRAIPTHPNTNESCAIVARIRNRGDEPVDDVTVVVTDVYGNTILSQTLPTLGPRAATEVAAHWRFPDLGFQPILARAQTSDASLDCDLGNNQASHAVFVGGSAVTDPMSLGGLPPLITISPLAPFGVEGIARYLVSGAFPVSMVQGAQVIIRPEWDVMRATRTNAEGHFPVDFMAPATPGSYRLSFTVTDGACTDSAIVSVHVAPAGSSPPPHGPNLGVELAAGAGQGCPPSAAAIEWAVVNRGDESSEPTSARVLVDGTAIALEAPVASLQPGARQELAGFDLPLGENGLRALTALVDPGSAVHELREDDNLAAALVRVPPACLDLVLEELRFTGSRVCAGESLAMEVQVANRGCQASLAARVALRAGAVEIGSAALPALAPGGTAALSLAPLFAAASCPVMTLQLDPEGQAGPDCDPSGDALGAAACVGACDPPPALPPPDFGISQCDLGVSNSHPAPGDSVRFRATIHNYGTGSSTAPALVRFEIGGVALGPPVTVGVLPAGGAGEVETAVLWAVDFTPTLLTVTIDPNGQAEATTYGNTASRAIPYELRHQAIAVCPPASSSMFSTCAPCVGAPFMVRAGIFNAGLFDCDSVRVEFWNATTGNSVLGSAVAPAVAASSACTGQAPLVATNIVLSRFGTNVITAVIDPANALPEMDETNNSRSASLVVACGIAADVVAVLVMPPGPRPVPGDTVRAVDVMVVNRGQSAADSVGVRLTLDAVTLCDFDAGDLVPGDTMTVSCTTPWVVTSGCSQFLRACADPDNRIPESNEHNNCTVLRVACGPLPDLIAALQLPTQPWPVPGDTVRLVEVRVTNQGAVVAPAVRARLTLDGVTLCDLELGDLAPGLSNVAACTTPWVAQPFCDQRLEACADPLDLIAESNEANNCALSGGLGYETDLAIFVQEIRATPPSPAPGENVLIQMDVRSLRGAASTCVVRAEWGLFADEWNLLGEVPLYLPAGYYYFEDAVSFVWTMPYFDVVQLRFRIVDVCPADVDPSNNEALATLPWYVPPYTPVTVSDFGVESTPDGVAVRWRSGSPDAAFALERRGEGAAVWTRLPDPVPAEREPGAARYEVLDRTAEPGARLEYRLLVRAPEGEEVVGTATLVHSAALPRILALHPVRPNPLRDAGLVEFSVPEPRAVSLCIYDAAGRRVAVLRSGVQPAGRHAVRWDGRDASGQRVPVGVYFCRLVAGGFVDMQRIVIVH